jgi:hypothetical protein
VLAINAMTPSFAENLRSDYFAFSTFLDAPDISLAKIELQIDESNSRPDISPFGAIKEALWRLALREPERSRRLIRLVWANWLAAADLPVGQRLARGHKLGRGYYYDPPPDAPEAVRTLTSERIDRWVGSTRYLRAMLPGIDNIDKAEANESVMRAALVMELAERLYIRENGRPPDSPDQLVGPYLKALPEGYPRPADENSKSK